MPNTSFQRTHTAQLVGPLNSHRETFWGGDDEEGE
jgi:hypothetical protein